MDYFAVSCRDHRSPEKPISLAGLGDRARREINRPGGQHDELHLHQRSVKLVSDQLAEEAPGSGPFYMRAEGHNLSLNIETGNAERRFCVEVTGHDMAPKKTSGMKRVNKTVSVVANYCPLCCKKCATDEEETTSATSA